MIASQKTLPRTKDEASIVSGEFVLAPGDFNRLASILRSDTGIHLPAWKATLVYSRLAKRLRALGLDSFHSYCEFVETVPGESERQEMCAALTTNVTRFFREPHHFEHLRTTALPPLLEAAKRGQRVRLWSSACSSGEEPYSIALTILSAMPDAASYDIKILATDINAGMVAEGNRAIYNEADLDAVPPPLKRRWFREHSPSQLQAVNELRALVTFRELNLIGEWPMRGSFNVIFCRNVAIYFDGNVQAELWRRLASQMTTGGWLYIGPSERISGPAARMVTNRGVTTYQRVDEATR